jgi:monofunctional biosynthetic peptidoglycan transglycosylase
MLFEGEVSLKSNGGFTSFRGPIRPPPEATALLLTVRGDGQRYKLSIKSDDSAGTAQYQAVFVAPLDWRTLRFVPGDFTASFRGQAVDAPILRLGDAKYVGLLIADRQSGPFRIDLKAVMTE